MDGATSAVLLGNDHRVVRVGVPQSNARRVAIDHRFGDGMEGNAALPPFVVRAAVRVLEVNEAAFLGTVRDDDEGTVVLVEDAAALVHEGTGTVHTAGGAEDGIESALADDEIE